MRIQLELNPERTAKNLLDDLINEKPEQFTGNLLRTLQRRVAEWRLQQMKIQQEKNEQDICVHYDAISSYVSLISHAIINK